MLEFRKIVKKGVTMKKIIFLICILFLGAAVFANDIKTEWFTVGDEPNLVVNGLAWFEKNNGSFCRLPLTEKENITKNAWLMSQCPSGARVRFKTDSTQLKIKVNHGMKDKTRLSMSKKLIWNDLCQVH